MKQTQTWSLAGEEAVSYSLARGKAAAVTRESGEIAAYSLAPWREQSLALYHRYSTLGGVSMTVLGPCCRPGQRENTETVAKRLSCLSRPSLAPRYRAWGARPEDHVITNSA